MCADGNQREMEIMGATSIATEVGEETTVNRESDASVLRIEKTICSIYIFLDFFFLRFDRKLIDFSARRDRFPPGFVRWIRSKVKKGSRGDERTAST